MASTVLVGGYSTGRTTGWRSQARRVPLPLLVQRGPERHVPESEARGLLQGRSEARDPIVDAAGHHELHAGQGLVHRVEGVELRGRGHLLGALRPTTDEGQEV